MSADRTAELAAQLLRLRSGKAIRAFRNRLEPADRKAVIQHSAITPADGAAIRLAMAFAEADEQPRWNDRTWRWDSMIFDGEQING